MDKLKFKINDVTYEMPSRWNDATFGQWSDFIKYLEQEKSGAILKININLLTILAGDENLREILYKEVPLEDIQNLASHIQWIYEQPNIKDFKNKFTDNQIVEIDGLKFRLKHDYANDLSNYEIVHLQELLSSHGNKYNAWELSFGILFRQLDENGKELDISVDLMFNTIEKFRNKVLMDDIYPILYFFLNGKKIILGDSKTSSVVKKSTIQILTGPEKSTKRGRKKKNEA